jgi:TrmH family RNA methyltransferase
MMDGVSDGGELVRRFRTARRDRELAVVEGFHALKHALRFGAEVVEAVCADRGELEALAAELAPDVSEALLCIVQPVEPDLIAELVPQAPRTGVVAVARRPEANFAGALAEVGPRPMVLLEDPRTMGNLGACIRVAAAADAAGVLTTGPNDPWHPDAIRGAAGLHWALPVAAVEEVPSTDRPLVAIDPEGEPLGAEALPARAVLAFGTERQGLSAMLLEQADLRVGIPMREGVSSLNLATAVAIVLFADRLAPCH